MVITVIRETLICQIRVQRHGTTCTNKICQIATKYTTGLSGLWHILYVHIKYKRLRMLTKGLKVRGTSLRICMYIYMHGHKYIA